MPAQPIVIELPDFAATQWLAQRIAEAAEPGDVVALSGVLGVGKTEFARAFIRSLTGPATEVPSPTFTLVQTYEGATAPIWHFDLYRLTLPDEVYELGWEEALGDAILLIEWPERLGPLLPTRRLDLAFGWREDQRHVSVSAAGGCALLARAGLAAS